MTDFFAEESQTEIREFFAITSIDLSIGSDPGLVVLSTQHE